MLYRLIITDTELSYDNYLEDFFIGFFESSEEAQETAKYYLKNVKGFCDFSCTYKIIEKDVIGDKYNEKLRGVYFIQGWNLNENLDEIDIVESQCYISESDANKELKSMKEKYKRQEWCASYYIIGKSEWSEGFCRCCNGDFVN